MPKYGTFTETAVNEPPAGMYVPVEFPSLALLNVRTRDGRKIDGATFGTLDLPRTIKLMTVDAPGHDGSEVCGRIDEVTVEGDNATGRGWLLNDAAGRRAAYLLKTEALRGNSIDMAVSQKDVKVHYEEDEDGFSVEYDFENAKLKATTLCMTPAFDNAGAIIPEGWNVEGFESDEDLEAEMAALTASMAAAEEAETPHAFAFSVISERPKIDAEMFMDPKLRQVTPLFVDENEHVFGHIAGWSSEHLNIPGQYTPRSRTNYAYFANKTCLTTDGFVPVGNITINGDHAPEALGWREAYDYYANTLAAWADVAVGEDSHGIWVSGIVRPGTSNEVLHAARASDNSGDWRNIGGNLELVADLSVPAGGFPKARAFSFADGPIVSLTGIGMVRRPVASIPTIDPNLAYLASRMATQEAREFVADWDEFKF